MAHTLFVNLPVSDVKRSTEFFSALGLDNFGMSDQMASVVIGEHAQVMLLEQATFAEYTRNEIGDPAKSTQAILVVGMDTPEQVDEFAGKAVAAGGTAIGEARDDGMRYQRGFTDLDGYHWEALCLVAPAS